MKNPIAENLNMENPITGNKVLNFKPKAKSASSETSLFDQTTAIAVVTEVNGT